MISRRDDEAVQAALRGGATKKSTIFELPHRAGQFYSFSVLRFRLCTVKAHYAHRAWKMNKIASAKPILV